MHLVLLEDAKRVGLLEGHEVLAVTAVEFLRVGSPARLTSKHEVRGILVAADGDAGHASVHSLAAPSLVCRCPFAGSPRPLLSRPQAYYEADMLTAVRRIWTCGHVYLSFTLDLTRPIQRQMDLAATTHAASDWLADEVRPHGRRPCSGCGSMRAHWTYPGSAGGCTFSALLLVRRTLSLCGIARCWSHCRTWA